VYRRECERRKVGLSVRKRSLRKSKVKKKIRGTVHKPSLLPKKNRQKPKLNVKERKEGKGPGTTASEEK